MSSEPASPLVSVIIPAYNAAAFLPEALASLRAQTIKPDHVEVVVVDDGSTDNTWAVLQQHRQGWPQLITHQQPPAGRPSVGRNAGLRLAHGRYVFFLDADDWLADDGLAGLVEAAERHAADIVVGRVRTVGGPIERTSRIRASLQADLIADRVWESLSAQKLFRRDLIDRADLWFAEDMVQGEDQVFVAAALFAASRVTTLADRDYAYRRARPDGSLSQQSQTLANKVLTATRVTGLVRRNVSAEDRSPYLDRVLVRTLAPGLGRPFQQADRHQRRLGLEQLQREVLIELDDDHLASASDRARLRLCVAAHGSAEDLARLNAWIAGGPSIEIIGDALAYRLPDVLMPLVAPAARNVTDALQSPHPVLTARSRPGGIDLGLGVSDLIKDLRPDRAILRLTAADSDSATIELTGTLTDDGARIEVGLDEDVLVARASGTSSWRLTVSLHRGTALLAATPVAWDERLIDSGAAHAGLRRFRLARTKHDTVRLTDGSSSTKPLLSQAINRLRRLIRSRPSSNGGLRQRFFPASRR